MFGVYGSEFRNWGLTAEATQPKQAGYNSTEKAYPCWTLDRNPNPRTLNPCWSLDRTLQGSLKSQPLRPLRAPLKPSCIPHRTLRQPLREPPAKPYVSPPRTSSQKKLRTLVYSRSSSRRVTIEPFLTSPISQGNQKVKLSNYYSIIRSHKV